MRLESALPAGSNTRLHALMLSRTWHVAQSGDRPSDSPRTLIGESWDRARRLGVDPDQGREVEFTPREEIERQRQTSRLSQVIDVLRSGLTSVADDGVHIMVVTDARGRLLWREGSTSVRSQAEAMGFTEGACWDEATVGTNGIGTGLAVGRPVQVFAAEHFVRSHHAWVCSAAPLRDPVDGRLLGLVDVSGPAATVHPSTLALVDTVTRLAHSSLREAHGSSLAKLRSVAAPTLARINEPALVTDRHGWVAAACQVWPGERVLLPESLQGGPVHIPSIGQCQIEPLFDGWLIRAEPSEPDRPTTIRLDLKDEAPSMNVVTSSGSWRHRLSPRHAEILLLLAVCPTGRSAAELSEDLFGDPEHAVTVRAEMSRLRRHLGNMLDQRPYRFPQWLEVGYELPDDPRTLLPQSTGPGLRILRGIWAAAGAMTVVRPEA